VLSKTKSPPKQAEAEKHFRMLLIPCSCGATFAVSEDFDCRGMELRNYIPRPNCGKRHDPRIGFCPSIIRKNNSGKWPAAENFETARGFHAGWAAQVKSNDIA